MGTTDGIIFRTDESIYVAITVGNLLRYRNSRYSRQIRVQLPLPPETEVTPFTPTTGNDIR